MEKPSRIKQVVIIAAILAALAVSGLAAYYIVILMMGDGREMPAQKQPVNGSSSAEDTLKQERP